MNTIIDYIKKYSNEDECIKMFIETLFPDGMFCQYCDSKHIIKFSDGKRFKCSLCRKQFSYRKGTFLENSNVDISKWFVALYLCLSNKKGISSYQLSSYIEVTQKTAWFMLQRIRNAINENQRDMESLSGIVEIDEVYIGGQNKWRHKRKKKPSNDRGYSTASKTALVGLVEREGNLKIFKIDRVNSNNIRNIVENSVDSAAVLMTDEHKCYRQFDMDRKHYVVEHKAGQFVIGDFIYSNTIEGSFAHLKGTLRGTFHNRMTRKYLQMYAATYAFRYNTKNHSIIERVKEFIGHCYYKLSYEKMVLM